MVAFKMQTHAIPPFYPGLTKRVGVKEKNRGNVRTYVGEREREIAKNKKGEDVKPLTRFLRTVRTLFIPT